MSDFNVNNDEQNHNVITNKNTISTPKIYDTPDNRKDEKLIASLMILQEYTKNLALKTISVASEVNNVQVTLTKILYELNKEDKED